MRSDLLDAEAERARMQRQWDAERAAGKKMLPDIEFVKAYRRLSRQRTLDRIVRQGV